MAAQGGCVYILGDASDYLTSGITLGGNSEIYGGFTAAQATPGDRDGSGLDTVLDGQSGFRIITAGGSDVVLDRLTLQNGQVVGDGAALWGTGGAFNINDCDFLNNSCSNWGGAVRSNGTMSVTNSNFTNNSAVATVDIGGSENGGAIGQQGATIIDNCVFDGNSTLSDEFNGNGRGGAIYIPAGSLTMTNSTFTNNSAEWGAGVRSTGGAVLNISSCLFEGNLANLGTNVGAHRGGALHIFGATHEIFNNIFLNNISAEFGGAISLHSANANIAHNTFVGNASTNTTADGIYQFQDSPGQDPADETVAIVNNIFSGHADLIADTDLNPQLFTVINNLLEGATPGTGAGPNGTPATIAASGTITGTALFTNAGANDYHLQSGSPAENAGITAVGLLTGLPAFDHDGRARDNSPDIGAFERPSLGLVIVPTPVDFGFSQTGTSVTRTVTIFNSTDATVNLTTITLSGSEANLFTITDQPTTLPLAIAPVNGSVTIDITFFTAGSVSSVSDAFLDIGSDATDPTSQAGLVISGGSFTTRAGFWNLME